MNEILDQVYFHNSLKDYFISAAIVFGGVMIIRILGKFLLRLLKKWTQKTETKFDDFAVAGLERFGLPMLSFAVIYIGITYPTLSATVQRALEIATSVVIIYFIIRLVSRIIKLVLESYLRKQENGEEKIRQLKSVLVIMNIMLWTIGALFLFNNLGYNITAIITGLGIGGIAIALAAQNILGDLFNYFVIFFDRPFEVGDFIIVDDKKGTIEHIGIKTTRITSLSGEQLIISNTDLTKSRLHNYKRMQRRRVVFTLAIVYETPIDKVKAIPALLKKIIDEQTLVTFDRAHFSGYGTYSLNFETVYYVETPDYNEYMDVHQIVNLRILEEFKKQGIEFAYLTQAALAGNTP